MKYVCLAWGCLVPLIESPIDAVSAAIVAEQGK